MHAYKKKDANPQKGIDSQGISIEKTGYCRGNFRLVTCSPGKLSVVVVRTWSRGGAAVTEISATLPAVRPLMPMSVRISTCPSVGQVNARQMRQP